MKTLASIAITLLASAFCTEGAYAATTLTGTAQAQVVSTLSMTNTLPLNFGAFSSGATGGSITTNGITSGGVSLVSLGSPAIFNVYGSPNASFNITPANNTLTFSNGTSTMTANIIAPSRSTLDTFGERAFNVTGTIFVNAGQTAGVYTANYPLNVNY